jgi:predicted kinase
MLIILGGLPGSGKSSIAKEVARRFHAVHLRIDTIEQALWRSGEMAGPVQGAGYAVAYALAEDNLRLGRTVIADSVNPIAITRNAWRDVAQRAGVRALEVEIFCSDAALHRHRLESRVEDIEGQAPLTWTQVMAREYQPWGGTVLRLDTAMFSAEDCALKIIDTCR